MNEDPTLPLGAALPDRPGAPTARVAWGNFTLLERVGVGGFGEVYRAFDTHLEREVALKLLLPGVASGEAEYAAMLREARALAAVHHANIVPVHGLERHDGRVGFWTDFVRGKTLAALLKEQGTFGSREAALIGLDVTRALSAVHRAGLLHRDIKSENVMREEGGRILLMDFGLSVLEQHVENTAGTPNYMAPELYEGQPATVATDIYAMGVLLYVLVAGVYPVRLGGVSAAEALEKLRKRRALMDVRPDVPEGLLRTVTKAMDLDPAKRFLTAGQLAEALAESLGSAVPPEISIVSPAAGKSTRRLWIAVAAALALIVAGWLVLHRKGGANTASQAMPTGTTYDQFQKAQDLLLHSYKNANVTEAISGFQSVLQADPNFALAESGLGTAYLIKYQDGHDPKLLDMAKAATNRAINLDANLAPPYVTLSRMASMQGQTSLGMQQAQKALSLDPRSAEAYGALAEVYEAEGKSSDAVTTYQKAIDLAPDDWRWPVSLGIDQFGMGNLEQAITLLKRGVELAPDNAVAYFDLGIVSMRLDRMDEARRDLEAAMKIEPDPDTYAALGTLLMLEGKYDEAVEMEKKSVEMNGSDYIAWSNLGVAYQWSDKHREEALHAFRKANELGEVLRTKSKDDPALLVTLANNYASMGERAGEESKSLPLVRQALALAAGSISIEYRAGEVYEALGQRAKAIPLIAGALAQGYNAYEFQHNPELAGLRGDAAFAGALRQAKAKKK